MLRLGKKKPSGQKLQGSGKSPARLKRSEIDLPLVAKAKALELLTVGSVRLAAKFSPTSVIEPGSVLHQLLLPARILFPPVVIGYIPPVAQQVAVPVLAATDAAIAGLESTNAAFHLVIGAREGLLVVALHQVWAQVGEHLQKLL